MKTKKLNKKIILLLSLLVLIVIIAFLAYFLLNKLINKVQLSEYDELMQKYGLTPLYNNKENTPTDKVTKIEALKLTIAATNNSIDLSNFYNENVELAENERYLEYAYKNGIVAKDELDINNCDKKAKVIDLINYISRARYYILMQDNSTLENVNVTDFNKYKDTEKTSIMNLLYDNILDNNGKINGYATLKKSKCNELIVKYVQKYNLFTTLNKTVITDAEKLPSNYNEYPFVVEGVEKEVYEQPFTSDGTETYLNPLNFYNYYKEYYDNTVNITEKYFNALLNVSYETINYDELSNTLIPLLSDSLNEIILKNYVDYVKNNNIKLEGKATVQVPCIYNDGAHCRVRTKLEFEIKSANTRENLLYMDASVQDKKIYDKDKYTIYIDARMGYVFGQGSAYNYQKEIYSMLLNNSKDEIKVQKVETETNQESEE